MALVLVENVGKDNTVPQRLTQCTQSKFGIRNVCLQNGDLHSIDRVEGVNYVLSLDIIVTLLRYGRDGVGCFSGGHLDRARDVRGGRAVKRKK
jgi:hypothetical protein